MNARRAGVELARTHTRIACWIRVSPRLRRPSVGGVLGDALRVAAREAPLDGSANEACANAIARAVGVRRAAVALDTAAAGGRKRVRVDGDREALAVRIPGLARGARAD